MNYLGYVFAAALAWGFWGFLPRVAVMRLDPSTAQVWTWLGTSLAMLPLLFGLNRERFTLEGNFWVYSVLAGTCGMIGSYFYNRALANCGTNTSIVIVLSAMYPVISILLAVIFLRERMNLSQGFGLALCISGSVLLVMNAK